MEKGVNRMWGNAHYLLAFTTLACPDWSWEQTVQKARHPEIEKPEIALPDFVRVERAAEAEFDTRQERT